MTDLDFDELDKAVNSLMGGVKEKDPTATPSKTLNISTTLAPDEEPSYNNLSQVAEKIGSEAIDKQENTVSLSDAPSPEPVLTLEPTSVPASAPIPTTPSVLPNAPTVIVPPRSSGRFMDVVHPSSDMRTAPTKPASREGVSIAAPTSLPKPDIQPEAPVEEPVPIDTTGNLPIASADAAIDQEEVQDTSTAPSQEPLSSPFLPDTKVEKRPLGGASSGEESTPPAAGFGLPDEQKVAELEQKFPTTESVKEGSSVMDAMNEPVKSLEDVTEHVPEEYKDELLAVEKNITTTEDALPVGPIGTASIPKQYQEKPSTGDESNGAIYDTTSYHKPLSHPAEKKSGWLWVLVIIIILLLGAAGGAAAYFLGFI